jgi:hypothetical protein
MSTAPVKPCVSEADVMAKIGDVIRGSLIASKLKRIPLMLQELTQQIEKQGGRYYIKNFWSDREPLSLGYVGIHIKIRMPLPGRAGKYILMEVQIHPKQIMDGTKDCAKQIAHRLYKMPEEGADEKVSPELVSSSQLVYLTSMVKLLCPKDELDRVADFVDLIEGATGTADRKRLLVAETALLLHNEKQLGSGDWNDKLQAVVPKNKEAVEKAWLETAAKINEKLNLPVVRRDERYSWTNTARSIDELYADAAHVRSQFKAMCKRAAGSQYACFANFGPRNRYMIKERKSLQDKINKSRDLLPPELPHPMDLPVGAPSSKSAYAALLQRLLENAAIQSLPDLVFILEGQFEEVMHQASPTLTPKQNTSYQLAQMLLIDHKISNIALRSFQKLHVPEAAEQKAPPLLVHTPQLLSTPVQIFSVAPAVPRVAFGAAAWNKYFGDIGVEPPLPPNIEQILSSPCPFSPGKTVRETQLLTLIPKTVGGEPFTLNSLEELVKRPKQGPATQYQCYWEGIQKQYGDASIPASYWTLFTKDVIPGSGNKRYDAQKQLIAEYSRKTGVPYEMPILLEAATAIFTAHVQSGTRHYGDKPWTCTRCQERVTTHSSVPLVVGGFGPGGLYIADDGDVNPHHGVGGARKFS